MAFIQKNKQKILRHLINLPGWHTNRKIVVIESDDWGSIRMPSKEVYDKLLKKGIRVDNMPYNRYDSLASEKDLEALFEVLTSVKDKNGNPAVITANTIVANPDFDKIKGSGFQEYFYEPFTETLKRYPKHGNSFNLWKEGIEKKVFIPQFHGREHLNGPKWLQILQNGNKEMQTAFDYGLYSINIEGATRVKSNVLAALDYTNKAEKKVVNDSVKIGANIFYNIFSYFSETFIAPSYIWDKSIENTLKSVGVKGFQGISFQYSPSTEGLKKKYHYLGQKNDSGQRYLIRNAFFEPTLIPNSDWIDDCLFRVKASFRMRKPVIIGSHRLNYIGFIEKSNRDKNLKLLKTLLNQIIKNWPEVEFMTSNQLLNLIINRG